jgi:hypothetical protein
LISITKTDILMEIKKPLKANEIITGNTLIGRFGIENNPQSDEFILFYREIKSCIDGNLIAFLHPYQYTEFEKWKREGTSEVGYYINNLSGTGFRITTEGELWLNQHFMSKTINEVKQSVEASNSSIKKVEDSVKTLDKRSLIIGIIIIILTALGLTVAYFHL